MKSDKIYIYDMLEAASWVLKHTSGGKEEFLNDRKTRDAVIRNFEVIGEAVKHVSTQTREAYPNVSWKEAAGLRDVLIHEYARIDFNLLWDIIQHSVPKLKDQLEIIATEWEIPRP